MAGVAWAILQPVVLAAVYTVVFSYWLGVGSGGDVPYAMSAYTALLPWTFFATSVTIGVSSVVAQMGLVTKSTFPRFVLPTGAVMASLVDFGIALLVCFGLLFVFGIGITWQILWLPLLLGLQIVATLGVVLFGAALLVFVRDIRFAIPIALQVWMYATPIIYTIDVVPEHLLPFYALNPFAGIADGYRSVLALGEPPDPMLIGIGSASAAVLLVLGVWLFRRLSPLFADVI